MIERFKLKTNSFFEYVVWLITEEIDLKVCEIIEEIVQRQTLF